MSETKQEPKRQRMRGGKGRSRQQVVGQAEDSTARDSGPLMHYVDTDGDTVGRMRTRATCLLCDWSILLPRDNAKDLAEMHLVTMHGDEL